MALKKSPSKCNPGSVLEANHITEDRIDEYVLQALLYGRNDSTVEQHLFCCDQCQARIMEAWDFIETLRRAIADTNTGPAHSIALQNINDREDFRDQGITVN